MTRFLIAIKLHSKASLERVRLVLNKLAQAGDEVHLVYVLLEAAASSKGQDKVQQQLRSKMQPLFNGDTSVSLHVHVMSVVHPFSSYADVNGIKARALCSKAASLPCSVIVIGGSSTKVRDAASAAFFVGHSTGYWVTRGADIPIFFANENRLCMPADQYSRQLSEAGRAHSGSARPIPAAA